MSIATTAAADDPPSAQFVSAGISIGIGSHGPTVGIEVSTGYYSNQTGAYGGGAAGFALALMPGAGEPWGRAYLEVEGGWVAFGAGFGPARLFGGGGPKTGVQVTPYVSGARLGCENGEPFTVVSPFYRYTRTDKNLHDGGVFVKELWFADGRHTHGVCTH